MACCYARACVSVFEKKTEDEGGWRNYTVAIIHCNCSACCTLATDAHDHIAKSFCVFRNFWNEGVLWRSKELNQVSAQCIILLSLWCYCCCHIVEHTHNQRAHACTHTGEGGKEKECVWERAGGREWENKVKALVLKRSFHMRHSLLCCLNLVSVTISISALKRQA